VVAVCRTAVLPLLALGVTLARAGPARRYATVARLATVSTEIPASSSSDIIRDFCLPSGYYFEKRNL
jgi:hypothetical protein